MMMVFFNTHCIIVSLLLSVTYFHLIYGQESQSCLLNATQTDCNFNEVLITVNNCSQCVCPDGFYQHHGLGGCNRCSKCGYPLVATVNCTKKSDTKCSPCEKTYYYTKRGCMKCKECHYGVLKKCGKMHNTICAIQVTTPTTGTEQSTATFINGNLQQHNGTTIDSWKCNSIWPILALMEFVILFIVILVCCNYRRLIRHVEHDASSLATSLSSVFFSTKSKCPDITALTEQERKTLIRVLPGGYAESLGQLLNPNVPNNWVQLAYEFRLTLTEIANRRQNPDCMQDLLWYLGTKNTTVEMLWKALSNIKRDDACVALVNFILDLRKDNESAIMLI